MSWWRDAAWRIKMWWDGVREAQRHRPEDEDTEWFWDGIKHEGGEK